MKFLILQKPYINFLISGGSSKKSLQANLIIDGKTIRTSSGNDSDIFERVSFNVKEFQNKEARFQIVDNATSMWGHINLDQIVQSTNPKGKDISSPPIIVNKNAGFAQLIDSGKKIMGPFTLRAGKIINSKVVGFKNGLCRLINVDPNPSFLIEVPGVDE